MVDGITDQMPTSIERQQFWLDVERALAPFPSVLLDMARALCWHTPSEMSRVPGQSRTVIYRRMRRLRSALLAAGIGPSLLFAAWRHGEATACPSIHTLGRRQCLNGTF